MNAHASVKSHPPAPHRTPAREALRAAIARRDTLAARLATAAETAKRAQQLLDGAQRRLDAFGDVDGAIRAHRADAYKAWAVDGGERPALDVPTHLAERQHACDAARQEAVAAKAARDDLRSEHAAAVEAHDRADAAVHDAAKAVLVEEADRIAAELEEALSLAFALDDELRGLAMLHTQRGGQTWREGRLALSPAASRRLNTPLEYRAQLPGTQNYAGRRLPGWQAFFSALQADADAQR